MDCDAALSTESRPKDRKLTCVEGVGGRDAVNAKHKMSRSGVSVFAPKTFNADF